MKIATPATLAVNYSNGQWQMARHVRFLDQQVMKFIREAQQFPDTAPNVMIVEEPPRHGKSEYCSKWLPTHFLGTNPDKRVILTTYEAGFSRSWGRKCRNFIQENGQECFGLSLSEDRFSSSDWGFDGYEGGMVTAGAGGPITGKSANLLIVDDCVKNAENAMSTKFRENIWDWWQSTAFSRLEPGGCAIVPGTRWHADDLAGRLWKQHEDGEARVVKISLPALAEENDLLGREVGEPLWPERWGKKALESKKLSMDPFWWNALYQQKPSRQGRSEWPDSYFENIYFDEWPNRSDIRVMVIDPSKGRTSKSDYSAIVMLQKCGDTLYVDADLERRPTPKIVQDVCNLYSWFRPDGLGIEGNANQDLIGDEFTREFINRGWLALAPYSIINSIAKEIRIRKIAPFLSQKRIKFKKNSPGVKLLVGQMQDFPLGDHDDGPDALEMAINLAGQMLAGTL